MSNNHWGIGVKVGNTIIWTFVVVFTVGGVLIYVYG